MHATLARRVIWLASAKGVAFALGFARHVLRSGMVDVVLIAGATVLNRYEYRSMQVVRALSPHGARPFDVERDGVVLGEGGGAVVVETAEHARRRGAQVVVDRQRIEFRRMAHPAQDVAHPAGAVADRVAAMCRGHPLVDDHSATGSALNAPM